MSKEISIIIRARNAMAAGLSSAGKSLQAFGSSAMRIGGFFASGFLAAGSAVAGFAAKAIAAYAEQEKAQQSLIGALNSQGEAGIALLPSLVKIADAIQDQTGADAEATVAGMAKMRMLGVQTSALGEAARAVVALKSVGLDEAAAQKAVANAAQGNFAMLQRYIPALKTATSEVEKATLVNDFFAKGYDQQAQQLNTVSGQWGLFKERIGDVWEEIGKAIMQNDNLRDALKRASLAVKDFVGIIAAWAEGGGMINLIATFKIMYEDIAHNFRLIGNTFAITWAALGDGADTAINYVSGVVNAWVNAIVAQFKYVGDYAVALWNKVKSPFSTFAPPDMGPYLQALKDLAKSFAGVESIVTTKTEKALAERAQIHQDFADATAKIAEEQSKNLIAQEEKVAAAKEASAEAEKKLAEETTDVVEKETAKQVKARLAALKQELSEINRKKQLWEELARSRVQTVIDEARAQKEVAKEKEKEDARAKELIGREDRGAKLGKKDKEFLDAWKKIDAAKSIHARLKDAGKSVEGQISMEEDKLKVQEDIRDSLSNIEDSLDKNLQYSE